MKTYIYILKCPLTHNIRYVGKTVSPRRRFNHHYSPRKNKYKSHVGSWILTLRSKDLRPLMEIIEVCNDNWAEREVYWISFYKSTGANLCNLTDGGEGITGIKRSAETKLKISKNHARVSNKIVYQYTLDGAFLRTYISTTAAGLETGIPQNNISRCCRGIFNRGGNYYWSYDGTFREKRKNHNVKAVLMFNMEMSFLKEYDSLTLAAKDVGGLRQNIKSACKGILKTAYGYKWQYKI